jgi:site-specific DNA recombinase
MRSMKAAGYVRVSTSMQEESGYSLPAQERKIKDYAKANGWQLGRIYTETGSGGDNARPVLAELFDALEGIDFLLITEIDRFGRDDSFLFDLYRRLEDAKVVLIATEENIDGSDNGLLLRGIKSALGAHEKRQISKRVKKAITERATQGKHHANWPEGYERSIKAKNGVDARIGGAVVEAEAVIIRRIFQESADGVPQLRIAKQLNQVGIRTANGSEWRQSRVRSILDNVTYLGKIETNGEVCDGTHTPIIEQAVWDRVHALRQANKRGKNGSSAGRQPKRHLFSHGLLKCGHCGGSMLPHKPVRGGGAERYECATKRNGGPDACVMGSVPRVLLDSAVFDYFEKVAVDLEATKAQIENAISAKQVETGALLGDAKQLEAKRASSLKRVQQQFKAGDISAAEWRELKAEMAAELKLATDAREQLERNAATTSAQALTVAEADSAAVELLASIRREIASDVAGAVGLDAVRASLSRLFDRFEVSLGLPSAEADELAEPLDAGSWTVWPVAREEWIGDLDGYWSTLLQREPLAINELPTNPGGYCGLGGTGVSCPVGLQGT